MRQKLLVLLLTLAMVITAIPLTASASSNSSITSYQDIMDAIEAIPEGGSGEITISNMYMALAEGIYVDGKDVTFNLISSGLSTSADQYGNGQPVIFGINANITINADDNSSMSTQGHTGMMGVVRIDNITDWNPETETFQEEFTLTVNGGRYTSYKNDGSYTDENGEPIADDAVFMVASGTNAVITDVICNGTVDTTAFEGVGITVPGNLTINRGKFTNDINKYVAEGKYCYKAGDNYYVADKDPSYKFKDVAPEGKLVFNQVSPVENPDSLWLLVDNFNMDNEEKGIHLNSDSFNSDYSRCILLTDWDTSKEAACVVDVVWNYNKEMAQIAKTYVNKIPSNIEYFKVQDMELINYWANLSKNSENYYYLSDYSGELKSYLNYTNFSLSIDPARAGSSSPFITEQLSPASLQHEGVAYHVYECLGSRAEHVIYVPDNTETTNEALLKAAQERIDGYLGKTDVITLSYYGTAVEAYDAHCMENFGQTFTDDFEVDTDIEGISRTTPCFKATVGEQSFYLFIKRDSSKMITPSCKTADLASKIEISTDVTSIPLDTMVTVDKLTSGSEYERVSKALNMTAGDMYDLTLHSNTLGENITKLENGKFLVRIPVSDELKGQDLAVYYVDANGKVTPYAVKSEGDFISFETDHFSIYTLATAGLAPDNNTGSGTGGSTTATTDNTTPKTGDNTNMYLWFWLLAISGTVIAVLSAKRKITD